MTKNSTAFILHAITDRGTRQALVMKKVQDWKYILKIAKDLKMTLYKIS